MNNTSTVVMERFCPVCCHEWKQEMTKLELCEMVQSKSYNSDCPKCYLDGSIVPSKKFQQTLNNESL